MRSLDSCMGCGPGIWTSLLNFHWFTVKIWDQRWIEQTFLVKVLLLIFNCLYDYKFMFNVVFHTVIEFLNETRFFRFFPLCIVSVIRKQIAYGTKDPSSNQDMSSFLNQIFVRLKQVLGFSKKFFTHKFINYW